MFSIFRRLTIPSILFGIWLLIFLLQRQPLTLLADYGLFSLLGVVGALFANATGAGGGVVFVPVFHYLAFSPQHIVATSFVIQCCGMTAGACSWWALYKRHELLNPQWSVLSPALALSIPGSVVGLLMAQYAVDTIPLLSLMKGNIDDLHVGFGLFSIFLAIVIFASVPLLKKTKFRTSLTRVEILLLPCIGFVGGAITSWLSVGVGELVAVLLILRGFSVTMAIAVAVIVTAFSVWFGVFYHVLITEAVVWQVVLFAGAGAIVGGRLAKYMVLACSVQKLKIFFGFWVLLLGLSGLPLF